MILIITKYTKILFLSNSKKIILKKLLKLYSTYECNTINKYEIKTEMKTINEDIKI